MTLQQIKEQVAKKHLYKSWKQLRINQVISDVILDEVSKEYAKQVAEQVLIRASEMYSTVKMYGVEIDLVSVKTILDTPIQLP